MHSKKAASDPCPTRISAQLQFEDRSRAKFNPRFRTKKPRNPIFRMGGNWAMIYTVEQVGFTTESVGLHMDSGVEKAAEPFLSLISQQLLMELGREIEVQSFAGAPSPPYGLVELAKRWIGAHFSAIRMAICPHFEEIHATLREDPANAAAAVADLLTGLWVGVAPFTVGKICVQVGLKHICVNANVPE